MTDLVDQTFPPIHRKWTPEFTDFNYWKIPLQEYALPDLSPSLPTRNSHLRQMSSFERLSSTLAFMTGINNGDGSRRSASPDLSSSYAGSDEEDGDEMELGVDGKPRTKRPRSVTSMPGTLDQMHFDMDEEEDQEHIDHSEDEESHSYNGDENGVEEEVEEEFDDDLLAAGAMRKVPFLYGS